MCTSQARFSSPRRSVSIFIATRSGRRQRAGLDRVYLVRCGPPGQPRPDQRSGGQVRHVRHGHDGCTGTGKTRHPRKRRVLRHGGNRHDRESAYRSQVSRNLPWRRLRWGASPLLKKFQSCLLPAVRSGFLYHGKMVYATCSILPSENNEQVENFLKNNPDFKLIKEEKVMPSTGFDGFYMALIERV